MRGVAKESHKPYFDTGCKTLRTSERGRSDRRYGRRRQRRKEQCSTAFGLAACRQKARYEVGAEALIQSRSG